MTQPEDGKNYQKIFVDAFQYFGQFFFSIFFLIFLAMILYFPAIGLIMETLEMRGLTVFSGKFFVIFFISLAGLPVIIIPSFIVIRLKYGLYRKIATDDKGISFFGLFRKNSIEWEEITTLGIHKSFFLRNFGITAGNIKMAEVVAGSRKYYFPLSMKLKGQEYPSFYRFILIDEDFNKVTEISPENCPLFMEIQKHLRAQ